jgi:hypothetical protein
MAPRFRSGAFLAEYALAQPPLRERMLREIQTFRDFSDGVTEVFRTLCGIVLLRSADAGRAEAAMRDVAEGRFGEALTNLVEVFGRPGVSVTVASDALRASTVLVREGALNGVDSQDIERLSQAAVRAYDALPSPASLGALRLVSLLPTESRRSTLDRALDDGRPDRELEAARLLWSESLLTAREGHAIRSVVSGLLRDEFGPDKSFMAWLTRTSQDIASAVTTFAEAGDPVAATREGEIPNALVWLLDHPEYREPVFEVLAERNPPLRQRMQVALTRWALSTDDRYFLHSVDQGGLVDETGEPRATWRPYVEAGIGRVAGQNRMDLLAPPITLDPDHLVAAFRDQGLGPQAPATKVAQLLHNAYGYDALRELTRQSPDQEAFLLDGARSFGVAD